MKANATPTVHLKPCEIGKAITMSRNVALRDTDSRFAEAMILRKGQVYRCQNQQCRAAIQVAKDSVESESNPKCCCGAEMKKPYTKPVLKRLEPTLELVALFAKEI